jgi:hypothetical protein
MSVLIPNSTSFFFSSDPANQAQNVSADGSEFTVMLNSPLSLPQGALSASLSVTQASIWNTSFNISAQFNNNVFRFQTGGVFIDLILPDGLYSLSGLNSYLATQFVNRALSANLFVISGDDATQKSVITFLNSGDQVDMSVVNSVRKVLGFNPRLITSLTKGFNEFSDSPANFNRVNSYIIRSNIVSQGIPINSIGQGIIAQIPIDADPGSQINYSPRNPIPVDASDLIGMGKSSFTFSLVDQNLRPAPTNGEYFSMVIVLTYYILLTNERVTLIKK